MSGNNELWVCHEIIKIGTFLQKNVLIEKNIRSHDVLNSLNSIKFFEILDSSKTPNFYPPTQNYF